MVANLGWAVCAMGRQLRLGQPEGPTRFGGQPSLRWNVKERPQMEAILWSM